MFNIRHQYLQIRKLREQLKLNQMLLHIHFSENYTYKHNTEIQSVHFGASNMQTTLHTGMLYTATEVVPFATLSESMYHDPSAIWTHLKPIVEDARNTNSQIDSAYFLSDGPVTQYKSNQLLLAFAPAFPVGYEIRYLVLFGCWP